MANVRIVFRNGGVELLDPPPAVPDGTVFDLKVPDEEETGPFGDGPDRDARIEAWFADLEPYRKTPEEWAEWDAVIAARKAEQKALAAARLDELAGMFP